MKKFNKRDAVIIRLEKEGKSSFLDSAEHLAIKQTLKTQMEKVHREFKIKSRNSQKVSDRILLTS